MDLLSILSLGDGLALDEVHIDPDTIELKVRIVTTKGKCPLCQTTSSQVHSHYSRKIADLPLSQKSTTIRLKVKRFYCMNGQCGRKIFCQRLESVPAHSRRTKRMRQRLQEIGNQLGGQAGSCLATLLGMPVSDTTIIRILGNSKMACYGTPKVLGVDDWSLKKGKTYGTILVDLEKKMPIDLLPDRQAETLEKWLKSHPGVEIISRDRATYYAEGSRNGAPKAIQIADRWHLIKNLGEALKKMLDGQNPQLRSAAKALAKQQQGEKADNPSAREVEGPHVPLSTSTAKQALIFQEVKGLLNKGYTSRGIAKKLNISRNTVNKYRGLDHYPARNVPTRLLSTVLPYKKYLAKRWKEGEGNKKQLWREIAAQGYKGSAASVYRFFENVPKDAVVIPLPELEIKNWSPSKVQLLLCRKKDNLSEEEKGFLNVFFKHCPEAKKARKMALDFRSIFKNKDAYVLAGWIETAKNSRIAAFKNFASGLERDYAAVEAAAIYQWSNGQVEGQVNRIKMIKRQMYGRAGFELLRKRVISNYSSG